MWFFVSFAVYSTTFANPIEFAVLKCYYDGETVYVGCRKKGSQSADVTADATFDP